MDENKLETNARELLLWKMKKRDFPDQIKDIDQINTLIDYLKSEGYISGVEGQTFKSAAAFGYHVTEEGKEWAGIN